MPNLTLEQRLVKPAVDVNPVPGHDLVVFRRLSGGGLRFHSLLRPDDKLSLLIKLFLSLNSKAYAVTRDQNLRHKVLVAGQTVDPVGRFTLDLTLALRVFDPQILVEKLESDPLGRLDREVRDVLGRVASRLDWSDAQASGHDFENRLLSFTVLAEAERHITSLAFLQQFAAAVGLELKGIQVSRAWSTSSLARIQRLELISNSATKNLAKAMAQITDRVDTASSLRTVMDELISIRDELAKVSSLGGGALIPGATDTSERLSILGIRGLGKELWQGIDPAVHVRLERDSWDS